MDVSITAAEFTAKATLYIAVLVLDAPSYAGHVAATHLICAYLGTRRYLSKFGWLIYLLGDVAWLELELMVSSWLQFDLLGATGRYLAKLSYSLMVCNAGGRLWRRVRRLLRFFRIRRHDRSLWSFWRLHRRHAPIAVRVYAPGVAFTVQLPICPSPLHFLSSLHHSFHEMWAVAL